MGCTDGLVHPVVPGRVARIGAQEAPGLVIVSQQTEGAFAFTAETLVGHAHGELSAPLDLPVEAAAGQGLTAQDLGKAVKPLWGV